MSACIALLLSVCPSAKGQTAEAGRTPETEAMLLTLKAMPQKGMFMFGHQDDPVYGVGWSGDEGRSDVKSVCGDYPALMSFDLGGIELGHEANLDGVPFDRIRHEAVAQYERGGFVTMSWHADNPVTGKNAWDVSDSSVVRSVLPGGAAHDKFVGWLDRLADFFNSIKTADGRKVPVLFRPWHEHTGSWFWWGEALCTADEYKALWMMTYNRLHEKGACQLLWAYSPGMEPDSSGKYLERWPADGVVDLIGVDAYQAYQFGTNGAYTALLNRVMTLLTEVGKAKNVAMALTETGYESIPDSTWWTQTLLPIISKYPVSYVLVWRNAHDKPGHFFAPYPGQQSADDFVKFYNDPRTAFLGDVAKASKVPARQPGR